MEYFAEVVQHETGTLQQISQCMRRLEIASVRETSRGSLAIIASVTGGSQADTEMTLDGPAPAYHLIDV